MTKFTPQTTSVASVALDDILDYLKEVELIAKSALEEVDPQDQFAISAFETIANNAAKQSNGIRAFRKEMS